MTREELDSSKRVCIHCGAPIVESMGACLARDVLKVILEGPQWIRERCGRCVMAGKGIPEK